MEGRERASPITEDVGSSVGGEPMIRGSTLGLGPLLSNKSLSIKDKYYACGIRCDTNLESRIHGREDGELLYKVYEESSCLQRVCCGNFRSLDLSITDIANRQVIRITRSFGAIGCCCTAFYPYCNSEFHVFVNENLIGKVREMASWWYPVFHLFDSNDVQIMKVRGPGIVRLTWNDVVFKVVRHLSNSESVLATITRSWINDCSNSANKDKYFIDYLGSNDLSLNEKVLILSSVFLIEMTLYADK